LRKIQWRWYKNKKGEVSMSQTLLIVPVGAKVELTESALGVVQAIVAQNIKVDFLKPISQERTSVQASDSIVEQLRDHFKLDLPDPIPLEQVEKLLSEDNQGELLEAIVALYHQKDSLDEMVLQYQENAKNADIVVVQGLGCIADQPYVMDLNNAIAKTLDAKIILVASADTSNEQIAITAHSYDEGLYPRVLGCIRYSAGEQCETNDAAINVIASIPEHDVVLSEKAIQAQIVPHIKTDWIQQLVKQPYVRRLSPPVFRYLLIEKARAANKRIVLPESEDPRTIEAAAVCVKRNIAQCVLLGNPVEIRRIAQENHIELPDGIEFVNSDEVRERYVDALVELRKHKGLTSEAAREALMDNIMLATMMLKLDEVDGLVSGAVHTTADTIRPALQVIKTAPGSSLVSSSFFMCLPDQVLVYADCAINQEPTAEALADIAIQSAGSAEALGVVPRVAMISFASYGSASGPAVDKVREAVKLAQEKRPDLMIDGPLQYDAAIDPSIGRRKAPDSPVAGNATVFVLPDLNTGNTVYKAVQRSTGIICVGPVLQGLGKPVNDLSRGCSAEDIVYTIAITALQSAE